MAIKKISEFVSGTPASDSKILFEQNEKGKSCTIGEVVGVLGRTRRDITNDLVNLTTAIAEQNLEKYGYKIGDYFIGPSGYQYNLADMDSYYGGYDLDAIVSTHHCAIVVDTKSTCSWLSDGTVTNYSASTLHAFLKETALNNIKSDMADLFGGVTGLEHLLSHTELDNSLDGWGTEWSGLANTYICALSESQVYGRIFGNNGYQTGTSYKKLELFSKYRANEIFGNTSIHLRSLGPNSYPCRLDSNGDAGHWRADFPRLAAGIILFY